MLLITRRALTFEIARRGTQRELDARDALHLDSRIRDASGVDRHVEALIDEIVGLGVHPTQRQK